MAKIFCLINQKGGTGKSTSAAILAQGAAAIKRKKVLAIDLDPQANLTFALGVNDRDPIQNSYNLLTGKATASEVVVRSEQGLDVIPASWDLATITSARNSARRLQEALRPILSRYQVVFIDCPAKAGELQYNALQAATGAIIPMQADIYNIHALQPVLDVIEVIKQSNPALKATGIILTEYNNRSRINQKILEVITSAAGSVGVPYLGAVRKSVTVTEAAALQQSIYEYAPRSNPAQDYLEILSKIL